MSEQPEKISYEDFAKVQMRVGRVIEAYPHPNADKLLVLKVDLGTEQRQICAGIRAFYEPAGLVGKNVVVVVNLAPRMMRGLESDGMLLAASNPEHTQVVVLTTAAEDVAPGSAVS